MSRIPARPLVTAVLGLVLALGASGCSAFGGPFGSEEPVQAASVPKAEPAPYDSQFTRDGTFQSHIDIAGMDFVYTLYPTKSTPRTNEWYPKGEKFFSFTFQAYDLRRKLRDPFGTKRRVYLDTIEVTSRTLTEDGRGNQHPYRLKAVAEEVTFDPEPITTPLGMLVTSPKGALEMRNQRIRPTAGDTVGIELTFRATVWIERQAGSVQLPGDMQAGYERRVVEQTVPIGIFPSEQPTRVTKIPVNAN